MQNYDIAVIGAGVAGSFAAFNLAKKNHSVLLLETGRPPAKRRSQTTGWLGMLPASDGKLYIDKFSNFPDSFTKEQLKNKQDLILNILQNYGFNDTVITNTPKASLLKKITKAGFNFTNNSYYQIIPKEIHILSKKFAAEMDKLENITSIFDIDVKRVEKRDGMFIITTNYMEFSCKKLVIATGRSGWRWAKETLQYFGLLINNDIARFGIRVEADDKLFTDFKQSAGTLTKENIQYGPLNWHGSIIPEDHTDFALAAFRSNENRWQSEKVSFELMGDIDCKNNGLQQIERLGKLTFLLSNDRILKEKISTIITSKSKISVLPEYNWLIPALQDLEQIVPDITTKGYFHVPVIHPVLPKINLSNKFETDVENLHLIGESAGIYGILQSMISGFLISEI